MNILETELRKLAEAYLSKCLSNRDVAVFMNKSVSWCTDKLRKHSLYIEKPNLRNPEKGDIKKHVHKLKKQKWDDFKIGNIQVEPFFKDGKTYVAVCRTTAEEFFDYKNSSGSLTSYLKKSFPDIKIPLARHRREYQKKHNTPWLFQFFDYKEVEPIKKEIVSCMMCDYSTTDSNNNAGFLTRHIVNHHKFSIVDYVKSYPKQKGYFKTALDKEYRESKYEGKTEGANYVKCIICDKKMSKINNTHLKKHGITLLEYKMKYGIVNISCDSFKDKIKENYNNHLLMYESEFASSAQKQILNHIRGKIGKKESVLLNDKSLLKGVEIDILVPSKQIGIEYNGLYYHSENGGGKNRQYHLSKTKNMINADYRLIHVFEDEWELNKELVLKKIDYILGLNGFLNKVHARKCKVGICSPTEKNAFLNKYHIQGEDRSTIAIGAWYQEELVSVMTFDEVRPVNPSKESNVELKRFCVNTNASCPGIFGRLLSFYKKQRTVQTSIISFADLRWTLNIEENVYTKNGFYIDKTLEPDYTYYNPKYSRNKRLTKYQFGKRSLKSKFSDVYQKELSEWEIMQLAGFDRIWDCGKIRYKLNA
jgi:hypothetical protein